ncbi:transposase [Tepidibacter hydrothermalis]|uniref:Mutator family transposase n=1 Tax=Tepidibacter hydrothermalis TaxID=3036126 RepID=A0ABY8EHA1_9FIRM|nr:transposase [Tepidibacter hydrothermalis]
MPKDRNGNYKPKVIKNNKNDIYKIEDQVLGMYSKGMSTKDITAHKKNIYGIDMSPTLISKITDKILPLAKE